MSLLYDLFRRHGWKPSGFWTASAGEQDMIRAFASLEREGVE